MAYEEFIWAGIGVAILIIVLRFANSIYQTKTKLIARVTPKPDKQTIATTLPQTGYEMLVQMETGLDKFGLDMAAALKGRGVPDPMTDAGYQHLVKRLDQVRAWRVSYESNPMLQMADTIVWPIIKRIPDKGIKMLEGMIG